MCFPRNFIVLGLTLKSLIHFELIFVYGVREGSNFIPLHVHIQFSQQQLLMTLPLSHCLSLALLLKIC